MIFVHAFVLLSLLSWSHLMRTYSDGFSNYSLTHLTSPHMVQGGATRMSEREPSTDYRYCNYFKCASSIKINSEFTPNTPTPNRFLIWVLFRRNMSRREKKNNILGMSESVIRNDTPLGEVSEAERGVVLKPEICMLVLNV